jgi:hypothetical protein
VLSSVSVWRTESTASPTLLLTPPLHPPLQIKDDWQAYTAALAPLLTAFGPYASQLSDLIVHLAKVSGVSRW